VTDNYTKEELEVLEDSNVAFILNAFNATITGIELSDKGEDLE